MEYGTFWKKNVYFILKESGQLMVYQFHKGVSHNEIYFSQKAKRTFEIEGWG